MNDKKKMRDAEKKAAAEAAAFNALPEEEKRRIAQDQMREEYRYRYIEMIFDKYLDGEIKQTGKALHATDRQQSRLDELTETPGINEELLVSFQYDALLAGFYAGFNAASTLLH